jgi:hypothetical protein
MRHGTQGDSTYWSDSSEHRMKKAREKRKMLECSDKIKRGVTDEVQ